MQQMRERKKRKEFNILIDYRNRGESNNVSRENRLEYELNITSKRFAGTESLLKAGRTLFTILRANGLQSNETRRDKFQSTEQK